MLLNVERKFYDVVIIGNGPAGLSAAIYTSRANLSTLVIGLQQDSKLAIAHLIENYPGIPSITGTELLKRMADQARNSGTEFYEGEVIQINSQMPIKSLTLRDRVQIETYSLIIAIGKGKQKMGIKGEEKLIGKGVSYCASCDGPLYRGQDIIAYGNINEEEVFDEVLLLKDMGTNVIVVTKEGVSEKVQELIDRGIRVYDETTIKSINGKEAVESVTISYGDDSTEEIPTVAVFLLGKVPSSALLSQAGLNVDQRGCISVDIKCRANHEGVFAAGDVTCSGFQAVIAAGQGARAGMLAIKYVRKAKRDKGKSSFGGTMLQL